MTSRSLSLASSKTRSLGVASLFVLVGAAILPVPGCSDEPTARPTPTDCTAGQTQDASETDCLQNVCQNGIFVEQADDTEIPDDGNPCTADACVGGQAQNTPTMGSCTIGAMAGTCVNGSCEIPCTSNADCNDNEACTTDSCDTASSTCDFDVEVANIDDNNPCTIDSCPGGKETRENAPAGTACGSGLTCDGNGVCLGCTEDNQCPADELCVDHYCDLASKTCQKMALPDGDLADDKAGDCQTPSCFGGKVEMKPNDLDLPEDNNDCTTDTCTGGVVANIPLPAESMCAMGVCDGASACVQCVTAANCMGDSSCSMNMCFDCNDGTKNGTESDVDCGRDCMNKCVDGKQCADGTDCLYGTCDGNVCVSCYDFTKNADETDIDCGGVCGATCTVGKICNVGGDCVTGVCGAAKTCSVPTCTDTVKNGTETDIDCGGGCPKCTKGKMCKGNNDCVAGSQCVMGVCN